MQLAVISDLHLGPGDASDSFGHDDAEFLRFLRWLERNFDRVVLLGDVWETLTARTPGDPARALRMARDAHPTIARRFTSQRYLYVHGNHDLIAGAVDGAPDEVVLEADGVRLLFTHGHLGDGLVQRARWVSELGVWMGAWIRRLGMSAAYRLFDRIDAWRGGAHPEPDACAFQTWAVRRAAQRNADVVVTGHTHLATRAEHGARLFLNSGTCSDGGLSFLALDTRAGSYGVHQRWR